MKLTRRRFVHLAAGAASIQALPRAAHAQAYPTRPVTVMVFVGAGGTPDIIARVIGQALTLRLGQSVVVENRPGVAGNLALQAVARAPADGYTLLQVATPHAINVTLYEKNPVNVMTDIVPIASTNSDSFVMLAHPSFPAKTVPELIGYAKANRGKTTFAHNGVGANNTVISDDDLSKQFGSSSDQHPITDTRSATPTAAVSKSYSMIDSAVFPYHRHGIHDEAAEVMNPQTLSYPCLSRNRDACCDFNKALDEEPQWLRRNVTLVEPAKDAVDKQRLKSLRQ